MGSDSPDVTHEVFLQKCSICPDFDRGFGALLLLVSPLACSAVPIEEQGGATGRAVRTCSVAPKPSSVDRRRGNSVISGSDGWDQLPVLRER